MMCPYVWFHHGLHVHVWSAVVACSEVHCSHVTIDPVTERLTQRGEMWQALIITHHVFVVTLHLSCHLQCGMCVVCCQFCLYLTVFRPWTFVSGCSRHVSASCHDVWWSVLFGPWSLSCLIQWPQCFYRTLMHIIWLLVGYICTYIHAYMGWMCYMYAVCV